MKDKKPKELLLNMFASTIIVAIAASLICVGYILGNFNSNNYCIEGYTEITEHGCRIDHVDIPNSKAIQLFCKDSGYDMGWLNSNSCIENQVMCYKQIGEAKYFDCVDWE